MPALEAKLNQVQRSSTDDINTIVDEVIAANPKVVEDLTLGTEQGKKAHALLMGQVLQRTKGEVNPKTVTQILKEHTAIIHSGRKKPP